MKRFTALSLFLAFPVLAWIGCGGGGPGTFSTNPQAAAVYVTGEDAPLSSVVSLNLTINSITLTGQSNSPQLVASPITVDFARLVGLRTPLAFKAVPPDTYSSATFVLASPVIDYISTVSPPQVTTLNGTFSSPSSTTPQTASVTVNFPTPMVVGANGLAGLHTEFDIRQSLAVDGTGQITGLITPAMFIQAVKAIDPEGQITDLTGTIVSVNVPGNSFVLQGPFGHQFTVECEWQHQFQPGFFPDQFARIGRICRASGHSTAGWQYSGQRCGVYHHRPGVRLRPYSRHQPSLGTGADRNLVGG